MNGELIKQLRMDGIAKGLCQPWQNKLKDEVSIKRLAELYIRGIDFCISKNYPTLEFIRDNFKGKCEGFGIFIDDKVVERNREAIVLNGKCTAMLEYDSYSVAQLFVRHESSAYLNVSDNAILVIDIFDDARLNLSVTGESAKVIVNIYGNAQVKYEGKGVEINRKNRKTY